MTAFAGRRRRPTSQALTGLLLATLAVGCGAASTPQPPAALSGTAPAPGSHSPAPGSHSTPPSGSSHASTPPVALSAPSCASATLADLDLTERAGQVLIVGVAVGDLGQAATTVRRTGVAGVFLRGRSTIDRAALASRIAALQRSAHAASVPPLHIAADQEGGSVQTLSGTGFVRLPPALAQGRWDTATLKGRITKSARALHAAGVTMNFAPVADTVAATDADRNPPIGALGRQYGADPDGVAADVELVVRATQSADVLTTLKHFPGLGRMTANTDFSDRAVDRVTTSQDENLAPFAAGVRAGTGAVMMSSGRYPMLDAERPAVFSPRIIGLLREQLGFAGLVVSDDLGEAAAVRTTPIGQRAVRFITAGGDLVLSVRSTDARVMRQALVAAATKSPTFRRDLDRAALAVLNSKTRAGILTCTGTDAGPASEPISG